MFRKILFWAHLAAGVFAGAVILMMSATGVLLTYEKQMVAWADERQAAVTPTGAVLPVSSLVSRAQEQKGGKASAVTIRRDPAAPASVSFGRAGTLLMNPYTGAAAGEASPGTRAFFRSVMEWHRWLAMSGPGRSTGRAITGACNLAFLFLVISGAYLWLPRVWSRASVRAILWFRGGLSGKARDFNWHNAIGFWCWVPLVLIVVSGAYISYSWVGDLVYTITGTPKPAQAAGGGARPAAQPAAPVEAAVIDRAWESASKQIPEWKTITMRMPETAGAPLAFTIDEGYAGQPQKRGTLTVNAATGEILKWETFAQLDAARRARSWLRFVHTGEYYGLAGQTVAGLASAGAVVLVYTGVALSIRRFAAWRARRARSVNEFPEQKAA